ncbi:MAG TPA: tRNA pseudouridine(38-40) synthase TruA [Candidatus Bathyarchaeia archaeon]|nr:tRNA pseudouridine(38-40) synthase TruA [Candidatus Bathyarchaeia archaeon]
MEKSKVALRLAYVGTEFAGFQVQPGRTTVQASLVEALRRARLFAEPRSAHFSVSGRTDKGVHALDTVVAFETAASELALPRHINTFLPPAIWTWARAKVPLEFDARRNARLREYRYFLCDGEFDVRTMNEAADLLLGEHDFHNFSREKRRPTVRTVFSSRVRVSGNFVVIEIAANSFVWNMMRKLVSALALVGKRRRTVAWFETMLDAGHLEGIRSAPASGLILTRVEYDGIEFVEDAYAKRRAWQHVLEEFERNSVMTQILKLFKEKMSETR